MIHTSQLIQLTVREGVHTRVNGVIEEQDLIHIVYGLIDIIQILTVYCHEVRVYGDTLNLISVDMMSNTPYHLG